MNGEWREKSCHLHIYNLSVPSHHRLPLLPIQIEGTLQSVCGILQWLCSVSSWLSPAFYPSAHIHSVTNTLPVYVLRRLSLSLGLVLLCNGEKRWGCSLVPSWNIYYSILWRIEISDCCWKPTTIIAKGTNRENSPMCIRVKGGSRGSMESGLDHTSSIDDVHSMLMMFVDDDRMRRGHMDPHKNKAREKMRGREKWHLSQYSIVHQSLNALSPVALFPMDMRA